MSNDPKKNDATIGALIAMVQAARFALKECYGLSLSLAVDGVDMGQSDVIKATRAKLDEIDPILLQLPREATIHMRPPVPPKGSMQ